MAPTPKAKYLRKPKTKEGEEKKEQPVCSHGFDEIFRLLLLLFLSSTLPAHHGVGAAAWGDLCSQFTVLIFFCCLLKDREWRKKWSAVGFCDWCRSRRIPQMSQSPRLRSLAASRCGGDLVAMGMRQTVLSALLLSGTTDGLTDGGRDRRTDRRSQRDVACPRPSLSHHRGQRTT